MTRPLTPRIPKAWRPRPLVPLLTLVVLALGVVASADVGLRSAPRDTVPAAAVSHSVLIANFAFAPQVLTITAGDSITWTNQDEAPHTVTTTSGPRSISSPMLSRGQSFTYTFVTPGTYSYYCAVHPDMRAQVVVNPAPAPASTPSPSAKPSTAAPPPTHSTAGGVGHATTPTTAHSDHVMTSPTGSITTPPASSTTASASAATSAATSAPTSAATSAAAPATDAAAAPAAASSSRPLDPALVLAGLTTGATVFCLLLVASRRHDES